MGAIQQGNAQAQAARYQAQVDRNNAILADRQAADARERGEVELQEQRRKAQQILGKQRAAFASRGVELGVGSPLDIIGDTATFGELDAVTIRNNADREGLKFEAQAMNFRSGAQLNSMRASSARTAGFLGAAGSALSGASGVARQWYSMS